MRTGIIEVVANLFLRPRKSAIQSNAESQEPRHRIGLASVAYGNACKC